MEKNKRAIGTAGITLIALVVTIIVLLILAGITISLVIGQNGIITRTKEAKEAQRIAKIQEEIDLVWGDTQIKDQISNMTVEGVRLYFEGELKKEDATATVIYNEATQQFEVYYKDYDTTINYGAIGDWKQAYPFNNYILGVTNKDELIMVPSKTGWSSRSEVLNMDDNILEEKINVRQIEVLGEQTSYGIIDIEGNLWICNEKSTTPQKITAINSKVTQIAGESNAYCAIDEGGNVWNWGDDYYVQLEDGTILDKTTPEKLTAIDKEIVQVYVGYTGFYAIDREGGLWSWGFNSGGQLGDGTTTNRHIPQKITAIDKPVVKMGLTYASCYAIDTEGSLWTWGENDYGQLGDGSKIDKSTPQKITTINKKVTELVLESENCYVLDEEKKVWCWGSNDSGQLGDGTTVAKTTPQIITLLDKKVEQLALGENACYVIDEEGSLWVWGANSHGKLGNGTNTDINVPQKITTIGKRIIQLKPGQGYVRNCFVTDEENNVWSWGYDHYGQLGGGTERMTPQKIRQNSKIYDTGHYYSILRYGEGKIIVNGNPNPPPE